MLVNLISSLQFISNIDASCLSINPIDYQMYLLEYDDYVGLALQLKILFEMKPIFVYHYSRRCLFDQTI